ncbi:hypothetical protein Q2T46_11715 [Thermoanaerobacterium sp. CMT5567-10]|uniref:hypothetical protein n=1 Tax=Thermoanaerobacterium sp. CMT5567-10 TaxID=3061989 RepID=UPI0026E02D47|nr:hypothetical protein [Thermoanaerobacterium sp. CMT5567-10]WKV08194.1 hypothetical protein Q2T46_11715 [Thermoanaerobacterium sp. CMT5567-10]
MTDLESLKNNLLEDKFPYFSDEDLQNLLTQYTTVQEASYQGCLIKSQDDSISLGGLKTSSNSSFWLKRAKLFRNNLTGNLKRADEV